MIKKIVWLPIVLLCILIFSSCEENVNKARGGKPKYLWFDAEANFTRFATKDSIVYYLNKTVEAGFNQIVVDVRPIQGDVLYKSEIMTPLTVLGTDTVTRDYDYLQFFLDEAHKRNLKVTVSTTIFPAGRPVFDEGPAYRDMALAGRTCIEHTTAGMMDIKEDKAEVAAFLNPLLPENQEYALAFIKEILTKYKFEGYALDYCRFPNPKSDFSETTRLAFEEFIGEKVINFPSDIYSYNPDGSRNPGKYYKQWWEFRSGIITNFIGHVKDEIKILQPDVKLEYWAASWINALYQNGQNWGSKNHYDPSQMEENDWASPTYKNTGFADKIDIFLLGTYLDQIYGKDDPESIEYGIERAKTVIGGDCAVYGTIYAKNHEKNVADAVKICLTNSEGLMVFDIVQVIEFNLWDDIRKGIDQAEPQDK